MIHGGEELFRILNRYADSNQLKGWYPQVKWLTATDARRDRTVAYFGQSSRDPVRLLRTWLERDPAVTEGRSRVEVRGGRRVIVHEPYSPDRANVERIQLLYTREHRRSRVQWLKGHFAGGQDVEIHTAREILRQSGGKLPEVTTVFVGGDEWSSVIDDWARADVPALKVDWERIVSSMDRYEGHPFVYVEYLAF